MSATATNLPREELLELTRVLFEPVTINHTTLDNRIVMAPMTREFSPGGVPGQDVADYYTRRAAGGVGLIITEGVVVDDRASARSTRVPRFYGQDALDGWQTVVDQVHAAGGRIIPQLWHVGNDRQPGEGFSPEAESIGPTATPTSREMTTTDINSVVQAFASAAHSAKDLGFDGIELHGAHGYLIDQFLWEGTNQRTDDYGGSAQARARFAADIVRACRDRVGPDFLIVFRLSQWKVSDFDAKLAHTPEELGSLLTPLLEAGVDAFHCSTRRFWEPEFDGSPLNLAGWVKKLTGAPTITVGSVGLDAEFLDTILSGKGAAVETLDRIALLVQRGEADLVAVGRSLLQDPAWAGKVREGRYDQLSPLDPKSLTELQ